MISDSSQNHIYPINTDADQPISAIPMSPSAPKSITLIVLIGALVLGIFTGVVAYRINSKKTTVPSTSTGANTAQKTTNANQTGVVDKKTFKDTATGILKPGGLDGEGSHQLERGAKDQTVYLTSSVLDLSKFEGKKVQVWGATYKGQQAAWLMDVGLIEAIK
ncbi:MAG: hypothetical protein WCO78_01140 [Candidatus Roizmanbacteria bacterium]